MNNVEFKELKNTLRAMKFGYTTFEKRTGVKHRNQTRLFDQNAFLLLQTNAALSGEQRYHCTQDIMP
ncbi:hypothetical protein ACFFUS_00015 [Vibrio gallaecicus]|uniref:hypothetical protein n=1 Tax=Vibrio gallaecicus TaxID=552386 RepID=UPI0010C9A7F6|nr:hypothetical protein [Vibrio gallaecicus]MDN3617301.1 hypothetical protein [Vibrio gallaecicus]